MELEYNKEELQDLMKDFYALTGIRIVLFDHNYVELLSYPDHHCKLCRQMKTNSATAHLCNESDQISFQKCKQQNKLVIYHCHAGLIEAATPLIYQGIVSGYMMFGQISDAASYPALLSLLSENLSYLPQNVRDISLYVEDIPLKSAEQIHAAAKIMEACTFYAIFKKTITLRRDNFIYNMDQFLSEHLSENLSVDYLTKKLGISKTKLYDTSHLYYGIGIAEHIRNLRIETAKKMLTETNVSITNISDAVGFADYNYFCRIFKKYVGIPAKKYRQRNRVLES